MGGFGSIRASPGLLGRLDQKQVISRDVDVAHGDFVKSFMNLPNLISFSRLASGPLLAWYALFFLFMFVFCVSFAGTSRVIIILEFA